MRLLSPAAPRPSAPLSFALLALVVVASLLLVCGAGVPSADAAAKAKRCPKGSVAVGSKRKPVACVSKAGASVQPRATVTKALKAAKPARTKGTGSAKAAALMQQGLAFAQQRLAAGKPVIERAQPAQRSGRSLRGGLARRLAGGPTLAGAPASLGTVVSIDQSADSATATVSNGDLTLQLGGKENGEITVDVRDKRGAGSFITMDEADTTPRCPTPAGEVPASFKSRIQIGEATAEHGTRHVIATTLIFDGNWQGQVAVTALAEKFDLSLRAALEVRIWSEIASTGKRLSSEPTRTYRAALDKKGLPVGTSGQSVAGELRLRMPKGKRGSAADHKIATVLAGAAAQRVDLVSAELRDGDERWFGQRLCARTFVERFSPEKVSKGDTAAWKVKVTDAKGAEAKSARWKPASSCGAITASTTTTPVLSVDVKDEGGNWGPNPYAPGCVQAEVTSTAGRAAAFSHEIPPKKPDGLRITVKVRYTENMGPGVVDTSMDGDGSFDIAWDQEAGEGVGNYDGREWDGTPLNSCGQDMMRARGFSGRATVGATRNDDDTITVIWTANERPLRMSFMAIVPMEGGVVTRQREQPFCGEAKAAKTTSVVEVTITRIPQE